MKFIRKKEISGLIFASFLLFLSALFLTAQRVIECLSLHWFCSLLVDVLYYESVPNSGWTQAGKKQKKGKEKKREKENRASL